MDINRRLGKGTVVFGSNEGFMAEPRVKRLPLSFEKVPQLFGVSRCYPFDLFDFVQRYGLQDESEFFLVGPWVGLFGDHNSDLLFFLVLKIPSLFHQEAEFVSTFGLVQEMN